MLPYNPYIHIETVETDYSSKTYKLDIENKRICGFIDDKEAILQYCWKAIDTERFRYKIYSYKYGAEIESLIGKPIEYVLAVIEPRISEALLVDTRIISIENFIAKKASFDSIDISFKVKSIYGDFIIAKEVQL